MLIRMESASRWKILGSTIDDAAGEAFDKVAKILGLGYPGGPEIDRLSRGQDASRFHFTRPFLSNDSYNFSFSGIKTAVFYKVEGLRKEKKLTPAVKKALAAGFQEAVCETLVKKTLRAAEAEGLSSIVVGGGVSANARLRALFGKAAQGTKLRIVFPEMRLCQDNAAMIAACGAALYKEGRRDTLELSSYCDFHGNQTRRV
jgi:N6-L-threonylcarbamoyladenine synthase